MKKLLLPLAVASALAGCGGGETLEDVKNETPTVVPQSTVVFDPGAGEISVPNDLLLSGTTDGTLNIPGEGDDYTNPQLALGALDGWSTQMPYAIDFDFSPGVSLDATSAATPGNVRIFEVVMGADQSSQTCAQVPAGIACEYVKELNFGVDFITQASGNSVAVVPLKPFTQGRSYITVLTNGLTDSAGNAIAPSSTYASVSSEDPLVTEQQLSLQAVINSYEDVIVGGSDLSKDDIIYSAAMTMQSAGEVLGTIKSLLAASLTQDSLPKPEMMIPQQPALTVGQVFAAQGMQDINPAFNAVSYEKGSIVLPYYLKSPQGKELSDLNDTYWQANCDSAVTVLGYKEQAGEAFPEQPVSENDAICAALSGGQLRDLSLDDKRHLTKYNTIPKVQSYRNIPVQVTKPADLMTLNAIRSQLGLDAMSMPAAGWPVVIMQHGITSRKEDMLALTAALSIQGFATVAIDHPAHGERGIDVDNDGTDDFNATTGSVLAYMNLNSLLVARDNLRQSAADLLGLRLGLNFANDPMLNTMDVGFVGHSLGAVVAPAFLSMTNAELDPQVDPLFKVNTVALGSGGGGIANFLLASDSFGPFIQGSVLAGAGTDESAAFGAFLQEGAVSSCAQFIDNQEAYVGCGYQAFLAQLTAQGDTASLANIQGLLTQFTYAAQTLLDAGDPTNYAMRVNAQQTPVYTSVVVGDGMENKPDTVIPPMVESNPIAGTIPLAMMMGADNAAQTQLADSPESYLVRFSKGHHGTLLTPAANPQAGASAADSAAANAEMQQQVATYLKSKGTILPITNEDVIAQ
ncbi:VolA/Pla-1 family phospholipase [Pseudoalteromonas sp. Cnat2-41]|uniref:VolA/Pla-1 family phospholipase n=1 Tax=unclassified Pseudoalteromonas TaxID=194690 RepID=UPI001EF8E24F|nr:MULTISPECIES: VolA/Pla-1 family phospholipase [unclassified Pseudoalteromonas]MCF2861421.1 lipase [Pseudoalteromonas sp. CNAT2-18]MCG7557540.1 lipase [Pseudoalteromonas sp. CNAT2-18.1]